MHFRQTIFITLFCTAFCSTNFPVVTPRATCETVKNSYQTDSCCGVAASTPVTTTIPYASTGRATPQGLVIVAYKQRSIANAHAYVEYQANNTKRIMSVNPGIGINMKQYVYTQPAEEAIDGMVWQLDIQYMTSFKELMKMFIIPIVKGDLSMEMMQPFDECGGIAFCGSDVPTIECDAAGDQNKIPDFMGVILYEAVVSGEITQAQMDAFFAIMMGSGLHSRRRTTVATQVSVGSGSYHDPAAISALLPSVLAESKSLTISFTHAHGLTNGTYDTMANFYQSNPFHTQHNAGRVFAVSRGPTESILSMNIWSHVDTTEIVNILTHDPHEPSTLIQNSASVFQAFLGQNSQYDWDAIVKTQIRIACGEFGATAAANLCGGLQIDPILTCEQKKQHILQVFTPVLTNTSTMHNVLPHVSDVNVAALNLLKSEYSHI